MEVLYPLLEVTNPQPSGEPSQTPKEENCTLNNSDLPLDIPDVTKLADTESGNKKRNLKYKLQEASSFWSQKIFKSNPNKESTSASSSTFDNVILMALIFNISLEEIEDLSRQLHDQHVRFT